MMQPVTGPTCAEDRPWRLYNSALLVVIGCVLTLTDPLVAGPSWNGAGPTGVDTPRLAMNCCWLSGGACLGCRNPSPSLIQRWRPSLNQICFVSWSWFQNQTHFLILSWTWRMCCLAKLHELAQTWGGWHWSLWAVAGLQLCFGKQRLSGDHQLCWGWTLELVPHEAGPACYWVGLGELCLRQIQVLQALLLCFLRSHALHHAVLRHSHQAEARWHWHLVRSQPAQHQKLAVRWLWCAMREVMQSDLMSLRGHLARR